MCYGRSILEVSACGRDACPAWDKWCGLLHMHALGLMMIAMNKRVLHESAREAKLKKATEEGGKTLFMPPSERLPVIASASYDTTFASEYAFFSVSRDLHTVAPIVRKKCKHSSSSEKKKVGRPEEFEDIRKLRVSRSPPDLT